MNISATNIRDYGYKKIQLVFEKSEDFYKEANKIAYMLSATRVSSFTMLQNWDTLKCTAFPSLKALQALVTTSYTDVDSLTSRKNFSKVYLSHFRRYAKAVCLSEAQTDLLLKLAVQIPIVYSGISSGKSIENYISLVDEEIVSLDSTSEIGILASYINCILSWSLALDKGKAKVDTLMDTLVLKDNSDFVDLVYRGEL